MTMAIILLHMFWGVVFFDACEKQRWWAVAAVVVSHLVVSCLVSVSVVRAPILSVLPLSNVLTGVIVHNMIINSYIDMRAAQELDSDALSDMFHPI